MGYSIVCFLAEVLCGKALTRAIEQVLLDGSPETEGTLACAKFGEEERGNKILACDTQVRERLNRSSVTKLSLKVAQNEQKLRNSRNLETSLSYSWQRDLIGFSIR